MKRFSLFFCLTLVCTGFMYGAKGTVTTRIYVSDKGDDNGPATQRHPTGSIGRALQMASDLRRSGAKADTIVIELARGTWHLTKPIVIGETAGGKPIPIVVRGQGMGRTIVSGGRELRGFVRAGDLWQMDMSGEMLMGGDIPQLFVNGRRAVCARFPNDMEFMRTGRATQTVIDSIDYGGSGRRGLAALGVKMPAEAVGILALVQPSPSDMRISFLHAWDLTRRSVLSFSAEDSMLYVAGNLMQPWNAVDRDSQCYLENDRAFLDSPGEFFYDRKNKMLYYMPRPDEDITTATAVVPALSRLVKVEGSDKGLVENITFSDLSFCYTRYDYPWQGDEPSQGAAALDATIDIRFAKGINFKNCELAHTGNWGICYDIACFGNSVEGCYLHDLGGGGIHLGSMDIPEDEARHLSRNNKFDNNILRSGSRVFPTGVGIIVFNASDNQITHNDISDFYYTGISVGWIWGYAHSPSQRNKINYNHIHHIGWGVLSDMGGIYTLGDSRGSEICFNHVHHIYSLTYGGWGIYPDEGTTGILIENNLVHHCKSSGFHQHYGKDNIIRNNIFVNNLLAQMEATRVEPDHLPFTFSNNIIQYESGKMYGINWDKVNFTADENLYWNTKGSVTWNDSTLTAWQKQTGKDLHSIIENPQFKDIDNGDFTIGNKAAIEKIHFKPFDYTQAGVYGNESWKKLAGFDPKRHTLYQSIVDKNENKK